MCPALAVYFKQVLVFGECLCTQQFKEFKSVDNHPIKGVSSFLFKTSQSFNKTCRLELNSSCCVIMTGNLAEIEK